MLLRYIHLDLIQQLILTFSDSKYSFTSSSTKLTWQTIFEYREMVQLLP